MTVWQALVRAFNDIFEINPLSTPTWLAIGATLHVTSLSFLPARLSNTLPLLFLSYKTLKAVVDTRGISSTSFTTIKRGRWTAELPKLERDNSDGGMVMFLLAARINHPLGLLAPGAEEAGKAFENMWAEASNNHEKWGYLGRTATLHDISDGEGMTMIWLSYWSDLKRLQQFSTSAAHRVGEIAYSRGKYPYMGIMHETFYAPKGCWETIYADMPPWGFAKIGEKLGTLRPKAGVEHSSMFDRMRRNLEIAESITKASTDIKEA